MPDKTNLSNWVSKTHTEEVKAIVKAKTIKGLTGTKDQPKTSLELILGNNV